MFRSQVGLILERMLASMKDWEGHGMRHLLCYNGESEHESYDCACCMTWPDDEQFSKCGCICHERIEKMARTGDLPLLFFALAANDGLPKFPSSYDELQKWQQENLDTGCTHYHNTVGTLATYPKSCCSVCCPSLDPHPSILYNTHTGELLPIPGTPEPSCQKCGSPRPELRNPIMDAWGEAAEVCYDPFHGIKTYVYRQGETETDGCKFHTSPESGFTPGGCAP
jgi:hypothetical protein